jgi:hypothetical protein
MRADQHGALTPRAREKSGVEENANRSSSRAGQTMTHQTRNDVI